MNDATPTAAARRAYWTEEMERAHSFMDRILAYPVRECGEPLTPLPEAVAAAGLTVAFSSSLLAGRHARCFRLRSGLVPRFLSAAEAMNARGWVLKVEDGFRSVAMQRDLALHPGILDAVLGKVIWENGGSVPGPDLLFRRLSCLVATRPKIGTHMSGSALDLSVLRASDRSEIDRGGPYLELSELTPMGSPFISGEAARNRAEIEALMQRHGFRAYPSEFWHFSQGDAYAEALAGSGRPARYGAVDFDPATGRLVPIPDPAVSLHAPEDIRRHLALALERLAAGAALRTETSPGP